MAAESGHDWFSHDFHDGMVPHFHFLVGSGAVLILEFSDLAVKFAIGQHLELCLFAVYLVSQVIVFRYKVDRV